MNNLSREKISENENDVSAFRVGYYVFGFSAKKNSWETIAYEDNLSDAKEYLDEFFEDDYIGFYSSIYIRQVPEFMTPEKYALEWLAYMNKKGE